MRDDQTPDDLPMPLPLEIVSGEAVANAFFPDGEPDLRTPIGSAFMWWKALLDLDEYRTAIENLSINPDDWDGVRGDPPGARWVVADAEHHRVCGRAGGVRVRQVHARHRA